MKKLIFGLVLAAIAVGGSAYSNSHRASTFNYGLNADGKTYILISGNVNEGLNCFDEQDNPCDLGWTVSKGSSFPVTSIPASPDYISGANASYFH